MNSNLEILHKLFRCPKCKGVLRSENITKSEDRIVSGYFLCNRCESNFPVINGIPRFVSTNNYADNFGLQWNAFSRTQLDSFSGHSISKNRFELFTGWTEKELDGKIVLDVGCGAGRFSEVALSMGAHVVSLDYSIAVEACASNLSGFPNHAVVQGDIYSMPFRSESFDYIYCLGVLQHTPDVKKSFMSLAPLLKPGGKIAVDVYPYLFRNFFWSKYWVRPITRNMKPQRLFALTQRWVPRLLPLSLLVGRLPLIGKKLRYLIPVVNYEGVLPLSPQQILEWSLLDTYDMLAPTHDHPQKMRTLRSWFIQSGLIKIEIFRRGFFIGRAEKPAKTP